MPISRFLSEISVLDLVASDLAYGSSFLELGATLKSLPDNEPEDEAPFPAVLRDTLPETRQFPDSLFHSNYNKGVVEFDNWKLVAKFNNTGNGFGAIVLRSDLSGSDGRYDYIVAFRGTDGTDPIDWLQDIDLGKTVWAREGAAVLDVLTSFADVGDMHFTGQSLGGGLAQYAAYDYAVRLTESGRFDPDRMSLVTFNGFGAVRGLQQLYGNEFKTDLLRRVETAHFSIDGDIVHRLGAGKRDQLSVVGGSWHLNGKDNTYQLPFIKYEDGRPVSHPDGGATTLNLVDAHRIEAGFYRGFAATTLTFKRGPGAHVISYIDTETSQVAAAAFSRIFNKGDSTSLSARARLLVGLSAVVILPVDGERRRFIRELSTSLYSANVISKSEKYLLDNHHIPDVAKVGAGGLGALALAFATTLEFAENLSSFDKDRAVNFLNNHLPSNKRLRRRNLDFPFETSDADRSLMYEVALLNLGRHVDADSLDAMFVDPGDRAVAAALASVSIDEERLAQRLTSGEHWVRSTLAYFAEEVFDANTLTLNQKQAAIQALWASLAQDARILAAIDPDFRDRVFADLVAFLKNDLVTALANANPDTLLASTTPIALPTATSFTEVRQLIETFIGQFHLIGKNALAGLVDAASIDASQIAREIEEAAYGSAQTIVLRRGLETNPFAAAVFEPHTGPVVTGVLNEAGGEYFTLYLPYGARSGGQKVLLRAVGADAESLGLNVGAEIPNVNGTFTIVVPEGTKQLVLAFSHTGDTDSDSAIDLSAQLIDTFGVATHESHITATLTLHGEEEPQAPIEPGPTSLTVMGDLEPVLESATLGADQAGNLLGIQPEWRNLQIVSEIRDAEGKLISAIVEYNIADELGNLVTTVTPAPDRADTLFDSVGADEIDAGGGADGISAHRGGDDLIRAGAGDDTVSGGAGNDWIEAGSETDLVFGDEGNDRLKGEAGFDVLSGDLSQFYILSFGTSDLASRDVSGDDVLEGGLSTMDILVGGRGRDALYAKVEQSLESAIEDGETLTSSGERGDWLAAGADDDLLVGGEDDDALLGGSGDDVIATGAGNDLVWGDHSWISAQYDWTVSQSFDPETNTVTFTLPVGYSDGDPGGEGDDRIHTGAGNDTVIGEGGDDFIDSGSGDDRVWGDAGSDVIFGGSGNDRLSGDSGSVATAQGDDFLDGEEGDDELIGGGGNDALYGGAGDDFLQGDAKDVVGGGDYLSGEDGDDTLSGSGGADVLVGGEGNDELFGDATDTPIAEQAADELFGGAGDDLLQGFGGNDYLDGGADNDTLFGMADADTLVGGLGNDQLFGDDGTGAGPGGADSIAGGGGDDQILGEAGADTIDGGDGDDIIGGNEGIDRIFGGAGADQIVGGESADFLRGEAGNDTILGDAGADDIDGGLGNDAIQGGADADLIAGGEGEDTLQGEDGDDRLEGGGQRDILVGGDGEDLLDGGAGNDHLQGGAGIDTYVWDFGGGEDGIADNLNNRIRFGAGITRDFLSIGIGSLVIRVGGENALHIEGFDAADPHREIGITEIQFTDYDGNVVDSMTWSELIDLGFDFIGTPDPDVISGTGVADRIFGLEGGDLIVGAAGDDEIFGGEGADSVIGAEGDDQLFGESGGDELSGDAGADVLLGGEGNDILDGGDGHDALAGDEGDDELAGGAGDDTLEGGEGADNLYGDDGADELHGGGGNDALDGGEGADIVAGGAGDDSYAIDALDQIIEDLDQGYDLIAASFDYTLGANIEALELDGAGHLTGTGNELDNELNGNAGDTTLFGLDGNDALYGGSGNDFLVGGVGEDYMQGDDGDDYYVVENEQDAVYEQDLWFFDGFTGASTFIRMGFEDTVESSVSLELSDFVENLSLTGSEDLNGVGNAEQNRLVGNAGDNVLESTRLDGENDNLVSGLGSVHYLGVLPTPVAERLWDRVLAAYFRGEYTSDDIDFGDELFVNAGGGDILIGEGGDDTLIGGWDEDLLEGGEGNDLLIGSGGFDEMYGGLGDDAYVVDGGFDYSFGYSNTAFIRYQDDSGDDIFEEEGAGTDIVYSNALEFGLGDHFENLTLLDASSAAALGLNYTDGLLANTFVALYGYGNVLDNVITGNAYNNELYGDEGNDTLIGLDGDDYLDGEGGDDLLVGGLGNDQYEVYDEGDVILETAFGLAGGLDEVSSNISHTLTANVENLYLGGDNGDEPLTGTGNELDNLIEGNSGGNVLSGLDGNDFLVGWEGEDTLLGGLGNDELDGGFDADVMVGGDGDDIYYVDGEADVTTEQSAAGGHDLVYTGVTHTLGDNIEELVIVDFDNNGDVGEADGTGNELANHITGNNSANVLAGLAGNDTILGRAGSDTIHGGDGDDVVNAGDSDDLLFGGEGNDLLDGGNNVDEMHGGAGDDIYVLDTFDEWVIEELDEGTDLVRSEESFTLPENVENLTLLGDFADEPFVDGADGQGNELDNVIVGNDGFNFLSGQQGEDTIDGRAGFDFINGDEGNDSLYGGDDAVYLDFFGGGGGDGGDGELPVKEPRPDGGEGSFEILASNSDWIEGGAGNDGIDGGSGNDELWGHEGNDYLYGGDDGLSIDADNGFVDGGEGREEDGRAFLANDDELSGGDGDDVLDGGSGNDFLSGGAGQDTLYGGDDGPLNRENNDELNGGSGIDYMAGGTGNDRYWLDGTYVIEARDIVNDCGDIVTDVPTRIWTTDIVVEDADEGDDELYASAEIYLPDHVETLYLQFGAELVFAGGNAGDNYISGNQNGNRLEGLGGRDTLFGWLGDDTLEGGAGDDELYGEQGNDVYNLTVGTGRDIAFNFGGGLDAVKPTNDLTLDQLTFSTNGEHVTIGINGTQDRLTLAGWMTDWTDGGTFTGVQEVRFCDGTTLTAAQIADLANLHYIEAGDDSAEMLEHDASVSGEVLGNDFSDGAALRVDTPGTFFGSYGVLVLAEDGTYTYTPTDVQWLSEGDTVTDTFAYEVVDEANAHDGAQLEITIVGQNDAPVFSSGSAGQVVEDAGFLVHDEFDDHIFNGHFGFFGFFGWEVDGETEYTGVFDDSFESSAAYLGAIGAETFLSQGFFTEEGATYFVRFYLRGGADADATFSVSWNGEVLASFQNVVIDEYTEFTFEVQGVGDFAELEFAARNDPDFWYLDEVRFVQVEEFAFIPDFQFADGTVEFADVDWSDFHSLTFEQQSDEYLGQFLADFSWGRGIYWSFEVANDDLQFLSEGETLVQLYDLTVEDPYGEAATTTVAVSIVGVNDEPEASEDEAFLLEEVETVWSGDLLENDFDIDEADTLAVTTTGVFAGEFGTLEVETDGTYTYTLDNDAVQFVAHGDEVVEYFDYELTDGTAATGSTLTVYIGGMNDAPVTFDDFGTVQEDAFLLATGNVLDNDLEIDEDIGESEGVTHELETLDDLAGLFGTLTFEADGSYSYVLNNDLPEIQGLAQGESLTDSFVYVVTDGLDSSEGELHITIDGSNDAPIAFDDPASVHEDGIPLFSGNVLENDVDIDAGTVLAALIPGSLVGSYGTLALAADGEFSYALDNASAVVQSLREGETVFESFVYAASDGKDLSLAEILISVHGTNDAPIAMADTAVVEEDVALVATGNLLANDADPDAAAELTLVAPGTFVGAYGTLTVLADASYEYVLDNASAAVQGLHAFQEVTDVFSYEVTDGLATAGGTLTIHIAGTNDAPQPTDDADAVREDVKLTASGNVLGNDTDPDVQTTLTVANAGVYGSLTLAADGGYTYVLDNGSAAVQALAGGETVSETFAYLASDGIDTAEGLLTITVEGSNDAPVTLADAALVAEDGVLVASGNVLANDADVDNGTTLTVANTGTYALGGYGLLEIAVDGAYSFALDNSAAQVLAEGESQHVLFTYVADDGFAAPPGEAPSNLSPGVLDIEIRGANDAPVAAADAAAAQEDGALTATGNMLANDTDVDAGTVLSVAAATLAGAYGTLVLASDGSYAYSLDNASAAVQSLAQGQVVSDVFAYEASDGIAVSASTLTVSIAGANDAPVVANPIADQSADAGTPFNFTFAADTFADIDQGDVLDYSATLADGSALPTWLSFDAAMRTFTGTPPGGGDGCDCSCGEGEAEDLQVRVLAADLAGASAFDDFTLSVAGGAGGGGGMTIIGTDGNDTLVGTACDDIIDGRKGFDIMRGGDGDDIYFVDKTCLPKSKHKGNEGVGNGEDPPPPGHDENQNDGPGTSPGNPGSKYGSGGSHDGDHGHDKCGKECKVDQVVENADEGYDVVYASAGYALADNVEELRLLGHDDLDGTGNALDNLLAGNKGDNVLKGGLGADVYVHGRYGGHDVIQETGPDADALVFGEGITADMARLKRKGNDLVVDLAGAHGSVTVKGWFSSSSRRVESIHFADGTAWDADDIRQRTGTGYGGGQGSCDFGDEHGKYKKWGGYDHGGKGGKDHDGSPRNDGADSLARRLSQAPKFDFERLHELLGRQGGTLPPSEVAARWHAVAQYAQSLGEDDGGREGAWLPRMKGGLLSALASLGGRWGFEGSTGASQGQEGLRTLEGLSEGFRKL